MSVREVLSLDGGWRFHRGDIDSPVPTDKHIAAYMANKAGWARGAARANYDDSDWRIVDLPHDWSVEGPIDQSNYLDNGFLPRGIGWYRRHFVLNAGDKGKYLAICFGGVSSHCTVFVNGHLLHRHFCGYTSFTVEISDVARFGEEEINTIAVRVDATPIEGWWYEGAGIYRHVWLTKASAVHVEENGVFVNPQAQDRGRWETWVETTVRNDTFEAVDCRIASIIGDASAVACETIPSRSAVTVRECIPVHQPALWSIHSPNLHALRTEIRVGGEVVDETITTFGYRTLRFDADHGFFLNGQPLKLKGTCNHQDHAGVGVAVPDSIHEFRIRRLKQMGCNAYRSAHNPPAPELLDACDRLGMLVMNENRTFGSSPEVLAQLRSMILRDRNHPSVILWSICNEEAIQGTPIAASIARSMQAEVKKLDSSRPVTASVSGGILNDDSIADVIEVMSINYQLPLHDAYHTKRTRTPLIAGETHCVLATRGACETDPNRFFFAQNDSEKAPWGETARETWRFVSQRPFIAGFFAWTGFDYRGEPSPHGWPCVNSQFGIMDMCGFPKDAFFRHKAFFTSEAFVHLSPHWTWPGREGEPVVVTAYSNCETVELFLNDESLGSKPVDPIAMVNWSVPYRPGTLRAVARRGGVDAAMTIWESAGPPAVLLLEAQSLHIPADGHFAVPVTVSATDAGGRFVPTASDHVSFTLTGPGTILGVGNGDPTSHELDKASARSLFNGLAQVIVQATTLPGEMTLTASASGLRSTTLKIQSEPAHVRPSLPPAEPRHFVTGWRMSPITSTLPDLTQQIDDSDMNTWQRIEPGSSLPATTVGYVIVRATFTPPRRFQAHGGAVCFRSITGTAEVFVGDRRLAVKGSPQPDSVTIELPSSHQPVTLSVLIHGDDLPAGLTGKIELVPGSLRGFAKPLR